jgi:hypothetical protein
VSFGGFGSSQSRLFPEFHIFFGQGADAICDYGFYLLHSLAKEKADLMKTSFPDSGMQWVRAE